MAKNPPKRQRENGDGAKPTEGRASKRLRLLSPPRDDSEEDEEGFVPIVPFDFSHKYVHFTYAWRENNHKGPGERSALLDVTDLAPQTYTLLRKRLEDDLIVKSVVDFVTEGDIRHDLHFDAEDLKLLKATKWCGVPIEEKDPFTGAVIKIASFVYVLGAY